MLKSSVKKVRAFVWLGGLRYVIFYNGLQATSVEVAFRNCGLVGITEIQLPNVFATVEKNTLQYCNKWI